MEPATNAHGIAVRSGVPACQESLPALCSVAVQVPEANLSLAARWRESEPKDREAILEILRSEERRVGKECVRTWRCTGPRSNKKNNKNYYNLQNTLPL